MKFARALSILLLLALGISRAAGDIFDESKARSEQIPGAQRDSLWWEGHRYRQWITDQNHLDDQNSNLDQEITFLADGLVRSHPERVYFYNSPTLAVRVAAESKWPLAVYVFDHTCQECLYELPSLYTIPEVVVASQQFVNLYIELPRQQKEAAQIGAMVSGRTVQFFLPGMRRLRVVDTPDHEELLETYELILGYISRLSKEELMTPPQKKQLPSSLQSKKR